MELRAKINTFSLKKRGGGKGRSGGKERGRVGRTERQGRGKENLGTALTNPSVQLLGLEVNTNEDKGTK